MVCCGHISERVPVGDISVSFGVGDITGRFGVGDTSTRFGVGDISDRFGVIVPKQVGMGGTGKVTPLVAGANRQPIYCD